MKVNNQYGLISLESRQIPLTGVQVDGNILGRGARIRVSQKFENQESTAVEAVYKFPLPEGCALCDFKVHIDGRVMRGDIEEREKAFDIYDDALSKGNGAYLLDEERPNIFTLSVGNLNPGAKAVIDIEYVTMLDTEGAKTRFSLPTTISPRYIPDGMSENDGIPVSDTLQPMYAEDVPYGISISLNIHDGRLLQAIDSPSHPIKIGDMQGETIHVTCSQETVTMDRDFVLIMDYKEAGSGKAYRYRSNDEVFVQVDAFLKYDGETEKEESETHSSFELDKEIIFVVDCSWSMSGSSIGEAKKALNICLKGIEEGTLFNIYLFGSEYETLFPHSMVFNKETYDEAMSYLGKIDADMGGTEISGPLIDIGHELSGVASETVVILITDGEVGNEEEIFSIARDGAASARIFPVGIGTGCNEYFIKGLARAGLGVSEFIYPGERIEPKVLRIFGKALKHNLRNSSILWGEEFPEQAPANPVIFFNTPTTVFARFDARDFNCDKVRIKGMYNGQEKVFEFNVEDMDREGLPIPALWARERIRDIEETGGLPEAQRGSRQKERKAAAANDKVIELSKRYGIISRITSYVVVEEREGKDKTTGRVLLRKVPTMITTGWHGIGSVKYLCELASGPSKKATAKPSFLLKSNKSNISNSLEKYSMPHPTPASASGESTGNKTIDTVSLILSLQKPEGGMEIDKATACLLGLTMKEVKELANCVEPIPLIDEYLLFSTALLLEVLDVHFQEEYEFWEAIVGKSRKWLKKIIDNEKPKIGDEDLMSWVSKFVVNKISIKKSGTQVF